MAILFWDYPKIGLPVHPVHSPGIVVVSSTRDARYKRLLRLIVGARKSARLTQSELGRRLRKPQSFVSKFELGERRLDIIEFLDVAAAIGCDPSELLREIREANQAKPSPESSKTKLRSR
jgi:hypothetical protein